MSQKTPLRGKFCKQLIKFNDQLQFCYFLEQELAGHIENFSTNLLEQRTLDLFSKNTYAPRINISLKKIPAFLSENNDFTSGAYFSISYETASGYYRQALDLLSQINPTMYQHTNDRKPEFEFYNTLKSSGCSLPDIEIIETLQYMRLRRNYLIHMSSSLSSSFIDLIQNRGATLNSYWRNRNPSQDRVDFTSKEFDVFSPQETIQLLGLLRIIIEELDTCLASSFKDKGVILYLTTYKFGDIKTRMNSDIAENRAKAIKGMASYEFGLNCKIDDIIPVVKIVGVC